jgi:Domain of unknown function (DUF4160)
VRSLPLPIGCHTSEGRADGSPLHDRARPHGPDQVYCCHVCSFLLEPPEADVMPTVPDIPGPDRFFFYSLDCYEPPPVHVRRERMVCKFWLSPVVLSANHGVSARELNRIRALLLDNLERILEAGKVTRMQKPSPM